MRRLLSSVVGLILGAGTLIAQTNTSPALFADFAWGQNVLSQDHGTTEEFWFGGPSALNRSYCVETGHAVNTTQPDRSLDTFLTIYAANATTVVTSNNDAILNEPYAHGFSRACWVQTTGAPTAFNFVKFTPGSNPSAVSVMSLRFVETTLFCPWFFIAGDYNAFSLIRNTSETSLSGVKVIWYGLNGTVAGTTTVTVPGNGTAILNARDFVNPAAFSNGSVVIAHAGSPQQITASTTTLSGTTGLGFDALFSQRKQW